MTRPVQCIYDGEAFWPANRYQAKLAAEHYGAGELLALEPVEDRSPASHRHYFAAIREAWKSIPEDQASAPWALSPEHLRKYALVRAGYADATTTDCGSNAAALRVAWAMKGLNEFAVIAVHESTVTAYTPHSQSARAMGKKAFQESKDAVLNVIAGLLGVTVDQLPKNEAA
ncbi:MAG: hypothetical protein NXI12_14695 [Alphaproteobacteria bacterium]|nr:hypothetical protein [Alphaproteobacteria bacterium]